MSSGRAIGRSSLGHVSGWSVSPTPNHLGMYQWSAYGPAGSTMSQAISPAAAEEAAKRAMEALKRFRGGLNV